MTHEMNEGVVKWAAQRAKAALEALDAHDKETRRLLAQRANGEPLMHGRLDGRSDARIDLAAQVAETSRVLVKAVLG